MNSSIQMTEKQAAGEKAAEVVRDGMVVGLGSGSTVYYTICQIGAMVQSGMRLKSVSSSQATTVLAQKMGITLVSLNEIERLDVTIDGADEVDAQLNGIKGAGGALFFEKLIATASEQVIWVVDSSKVVTRLGARPLPIEVTPFAYRQIYGKMHAAGLRPVIRLAGEQPYCTDSGNYIIDLQTNELQEPQALADWLQAVPGIIAHGLFIACATQVVVGRGNSTELITRPQISLKS